MEPKLFLTPTETIGVIIQNGKRVMTQCRRRTFLLALLAGFYIAFGAQLSTVVTQDSAVFVGLGISRLLGGMVFSVGLMLVVVCGGELFTGNSLLVSSALDGEISWGKLAENWGLVLLGNLLGSLFMAWLLFESQLW
ncbi:MAG: formate/nitrite transporter family protein, partial [Geobacter sp.]